MVRRKKRYLLVSKSLSKDVCRDLGVYFIESKGDYTIVRCYLAELSMINDRFRKVGIEIERISGTIKSLREVLNNRR